VNAFDQPDVQDAKQRTLAKIDAYHEEGRLEEGNRLWEGEGVQAYGATLPVGLAGRAGFGLQEILSAFLAQGRPGEYVALNAYLPRNDHYNDLLTRARIAIRKHTRLATTVGFGPRFLHSTGQLHKGGPNTGLFLEITADPVQDVEIPGERLTFGTLERAQALGDMEALLARGRRVLRLHLNQPEGLVGFVELVEQLGVKA
jgi:transaldolase/glucose-6-phosphate isomerase